MKRYLRIAAAIGFVIALTFVGLYDYSTHVVRGWLRGEAFFDGRPTSFWRGVVEHDLRCDVREIPLANYGAPDTWWRSAKERLRLDTAKQSSRDLVTWQFHMNYHNEKSSARDAVLKELADDPNEKIAGFAADAPKCTPWSAVESYWHGLLRKHHIADTR